MILTTTLFFIFVLRNYFEDKVKVPFISMRIILNNTNYTKYNLISEWLVELSIQQRKTPLLKHCRPTDEKKFRLI